MGTTFLSLPREELKERFYKLRTRQDIATLLEISDYQLRYHLYIYPRKQVYTTFKIPKKSGGYRSISAPKTAIKIIQQKLNQVFSSVYQPKPSTHGFTVNKSIITNAGQHLRQRYILNIDLKDFFPSINFGRVRGLLRAKPYNCPDEVATVLAQICCHDNQLPQGAPTSPIVSNMICAKLDSQLQRLAKKYQCIYTRYADDITFSTSRSRFPSHLVWFSKEANRLFLGDELKNIIEDNGFLINESKIRLQNRYKHQEVTGITVNEKLNVKRKYIRQIQAVLHAWEKYGLEKAADHFWQRYTKDLLNKNYDDEAFRSIIRSRIEFIGSVRGKTDKIYINLLKWLKKLAPDLVNESKLSYSDYETFDCNKYSLPKVEIWTEGKTDIKHFESALRWLKDKGHSFEFHLDFKKDLDENKQGSKQLLTMCEQFCKEKRDPPIIAIFDRDEPDIMKKVHDDSRGFKDWGNGVYSFAIPIPTHRQDVKDICIELYYKDEEIQRTDNNGRRLFLSTEFNDNSSKHKEDLFLNTTTRIKPNQMKIIADDVFDSNHTNIALSKEKFADYIFTNVLNFNNFDFSEFKDVFRIIGNILKYHAESSANTVA